MDARELPPRSSATASTSQIIGRTLSLGLIVVVATLVIGYPLAYFLARTRSPLRPWLIVLVVFPLLLNLVVRSFGWIVLLANRGLINDWLIAAGHDRDADHAPLQLRRPADRA